MRKALFVAALAVLAVAAAPGRLPAQTAAEIVLSELEKSIVNEYYRAKAQALGAASASTGSAKTQRGRPADVAQDRDKKGKGTPPGQAKKDGLPPGLAKRDSLPPGLARKDKLPPGLQRDPLPADLIAKLPPARVGTERVLVGYDLVLIDRATNVVLDFLKDVALRAP